MKAFAFCGPVIYDFPLAEGVKRGVLTKGRVLQLLFEALPLESCESASIYAQQVVENDTKIDAWRLMTNHLVANDNYIITLADRKLHITALADVTEHEYRVASGATSRRDRLRAQNRFSKGNVQHIIASRIFKKGVSIPRVDVMFDLAEWKSKNDAIQKFGRGLRLFETKTELIYIDFGTQGNNTLGEAAVSRANAFKHSGIPVTKVKVSTPLQALTALKQFLKKEDPCQQKLFA